MNCWRRGAGNLGRSLCFLALLSCLAVLGWAQLPVRDQGTLVVTQHGQPLGEEHFTLRRTARGASLDADLDYRVEGKEVRQQAALRLAPDGAIESYRWSEGGSAITVHYVHGRLAAHYQRAKEAGSDYGYQMPATTSILDVNVFSLWELLANCYDRARGGVQKFGVFVPQSGDPSQVSLSEAKPPRPGADWKLKAVTDDADLDLTLRDGKLMSIEVPASGVEIHRVVAAKTP